MLEQYLEDKGIRLINLTPTTVEHGFQLDYDIENFLDLELASKLVIEAIEANKRIALVSDYDCDGITSNIVASKFFKEYLKYENTISIVNKRNWGNGLNKNLLSSIRDENNKAKIDLVISFDHTIGNNKEIGWLKNAIGCKYILTDHHTIPKEYPSNADVVINIMRNEQKFIQPGFKSISGCHTGFLLCIKIYKDLNKNIKDLYPLLYYSAISTVVDQMDMNTTYNRELVKTGLHCVVNKDPSNLLLSRKLDLPILPLNKNIGWTIGPYINSGNRCGTEEQVFTGILQADERCFNLSLQENLRKKEEQKELITQASLAYLEKYDGTEFGVAITVDSLYGIAGVLANKLGENINRPCIVFRSNPDDTILLGSGRAIWKDLNLLNILKSIQDKFADVIIKVAGHQGACGIEIYTEKLDIFRKLFSDAVKQAVNNKIPKEYLSATYIENKDIHLGLALQVEENGPYGFNKETPLFISKLKYLKSFAIPNGRIINFARDNKTILSGVYFFDRDNGLTEDNFTSKIKSNTDYYIVFEYQLGYKNNKYQLDLSIKDIIDKE